MAKLNFAKLLESTRARVLLVFLGLIVIIALFITIFKMGSGSSSSSSGRSTVPRFSPTIKSVPDSRDLNQQYLKTLVESNRLEAQQALKTGGSSIPTLIGSGSNGYDVGSSLTAGALECQSFCGKYQSCGCNCGPGKQGNLPSTSSLLNQMVNSGGLSPVTAAELSKLQDDGVSVSDYAANLNRLVREGKLTPDQAKQLLAAYRQEYGKSGGGTSAEDLVTQLAASGGISADTAAELQKLSNGSLPVEDYASNLDRLVQEGKLTPEQAKQLLAAYRRDHGQPTPAGDLVDEMVATGAIPPDVANQLKQLSDSSGGSEANYEAGLKQLVAAGKLTPDQAQRLLAAYRQAHGLSSTPSANAGIDALEAAGDITPQVASQLRQLANSGLAADDYAAKLKQLVATGQLTPEQARQLLADYKKAKGLSQAPTANELLSQMQSAGDISPSVANQLEKLSSSGATVSGYASKLRQLVASGQLTPDQAKKLLAAYRQEHGVSGTATDNLLDSMETAGDISPDVVGQLKNLSAQNVSAGQYADELNRLVQDGKLTPEQASQLLDSYRQSHGLTSVPHAQNLIGQMAASGAISPAVADQLNSLAGSGVSVGDYAANLDQMVKAGKLTPEQARQLLAAYRRERAGASAGMVPNVDAMTDQMVADGHLSPTIGDQLKQIADAGVPSAEYAETLTRLVSQAKITPTEAMKLLNAYRTMHGDTSVIGQQNPALEQLARDQQTEALNNQLDALQRQQQAYESQLTANGGTPEEVTQLTSDMRTQIQALITSWSPVPQEMRGGAVASNAGKSDSALGELKKDQGKENNSEDESSNSQSKSGAKKSAYPLIKAGTIMFAVLDTAVNSDEAGPVMATMVAGPYKGAKLIGTLTQTGDGERVMLQFNLMSKSEWPENLSITAVAINPDTAHTAIASDVDHHYLMRWGSLFASNFLEGYANAITQSGSTIMNNSGTTTTQNANYSPRDKALIGLGKVGEQLSNVSAKWINKAPTVKVDAGVGVGILFTSDVFGEIPGK